LPTGLRCSGSIALSGGRVKWIKSTNGKLGRSVVEYHVPLENVILRSSGLNLTCVLHHMDG